MEFTQGLPLATEFCLGLTSKTEKLCPRECSESCFIKVPLPEVSFSGMLYQKSVLYIYICISFTLTSIDFPASAAPGAHFLPLAPLAGRLLFLLEAQIHAFPAITGPDLPAASQCPWRRPVQDSCAAGCAWCRLLLLHTLCSIKHPERFVELPLNLVLGSRGFPEEFGTNLPPTPFSAVYWENWQGSGW